MFTPIESSYSYYNLPSDIEDFNETDHEAISNLLLGHAVTKVSEDHLVLDDGTVLRFVGHEGGCSCSAGDYDLTVLNGTDNIITDVIFEDRPSGDDYGYSDYQGYYRIFVFAGNDKINLATFEGSDGNGYYGTGYSILVRKECND